MPTVAESPRFNLLEVEPILPAFSPELAPYLIELAREQELNKIIATEAVGANARIEQHFQEARIADYVVFVIGCDDSRADVPTGLQKIRGMKILFQFIPTIGAGVPNKKTLLGILQEYKSHAVNSNKFIIINAQHGSAQEVSHAMRKGKSSLRPCTCGARHHFHDKDIPLPLQVHLQATMKSSDIVTNSELVTEDIRLILQKRYSHVPLESALLNHQDKKLNFTKKSEVFGKTLTIPEQQAWLDSHQDPRFIVLSVGPRAASVPDGVVLNYTVGRGSNNDFNSVTSGSPKDIRARLAEVWYALHSKVKSIEARGEDSEKPTGNFENTEAFIVIADSEEMMQDVITALESEEMRPMMEKGINTLGGVRFVVLKSENAHGKEKVFHWQYAQEEAVA